MRMGKLERTQGKCSACRVFYQWFAPPLLREAACPRCKRPLERTTHLSKLPRSDEAVLRREAR